MRMCHSKEYWDNFTSGENLTEHQLQYMYLCQLEMFAYKIKDCEDYERIKGGLVLVQHQYGRRIMIKDISYILDKTGLTEWQKFKLKFQYMFL